MYINSVEWDGLAHVPIIVASGSSNSFKVFAVSALVASVALILFGSLLLVGCASLPLAFFLGTVFVGATSLALISRVLVPLLLKPEKTRHLKSLAIISHKIQLINRNLKVYKWEMSLLIKKLKRGEDPRLIASQMKRLLESGPD